MGLFVYRENTIFFIFHPQCPQDIPILSWLLYIQAKDVLVYDGKIAGGLKIEISTVYLYYYIGIIILQILFDENVNRLIDCIAIYFDLGVVAHGVDLLWPINLCASISSTIDTKEIYNINDLRVRSFRDYKHTWPWINQNSSILVHRSFI
jgi:hypothetical protein